jgi:hypothetical protein
MPTRTCTRIAALAGAGLIALTAAASAGGSGRGSCGCNVTVNKPVTINKPVVINKSVTINKPVTIEKNVTINKTVDASKTITINKDVTINKSIVIEKGGSADAAAFAASVAAANAGASANVNVTVYGGNYYDDSVTHNHFGGEIGAIHAAQACAMQEASVIKSIHAVCVAADGREFPASHMTEKTFLDASYEGEILRCIPGLRLKIAVGDMLQSDQGMAGTYASGQTLQCGQNEALRHFKGGVLKCAPAVPVPDCTERTNLRKYGSSDLFFTFRSQVCAAPATTAQGREADLGGMPLDGGVGE